jgi:asparagine synthase (glutamine-hydrolysing)
MAGEDGRVQIVYNGEVYNFREIRRRLEGLGYRFRGSSDTEVVLNAYLHWGIAAVERMVGMFAMAIWDRRKQRLYLVRDRLGIKPLYYYHGRGLFLFASELKALMAFSCFPRVVDDDAVSRFLHYQYVPAPGSIFRDTWKLPPGRCLVYDGERPVIRAYWHSRQPGRWGPDAPVDEGRCLNELDRRIRRAVADRLVSDVPLGALLSGGIDSTLVAAMMQRAADRPIRTFSIGFREAGYDEAPWAAKVAAYLGTDHTERYVTAADALAVIPRMPEIYCEPFADSSGIPTFLVSRMVKDRVTVALSGDGGDEQFAGYVRYWMTRSMHAALKRLPGGLRRLLCRRLQQIPPTLVAALYHPLRHRLPQRFRVANFPDKWRKWVRLTGAGGIMDLYRATVSVWPLDEVAELTGRTPGPSMFEAAFEAAARLPLLAALMHVDRETYLPDAMLTKVDRASMAVGLEVRVPLLDHRVVEYAAAIPDALKYRGGSGKYLLKRLLERYVPARLFERPKMGFGVPIGRWFRGELKALLLDYLSPECLKKEARFDPRLVEARLKEHFSGENDHQHQLWALLMWEMWRERWIGR